MKRLYKFLSLMLVTCLCVCTVTASSGLNAYAGVSDLTVVDSQSLSGVNELPGSLWYLGGTSGTSVSNGEIVFAPTKTDSRFNLRRKINNLAECGVDLNFELNAKVQLANVDNITYAFSFGMAKVNSKLQDGDAYLYFANQGGTVGFGLKNKEKDFVAFTAITGFNAANYVDVNLKVMSDGSAAGSVDGTNFNANGLPLEGYAGFGIIGESVENNLVKMKDLSINAYVNDTPENTDCFEDFDMNCFCINTFSAKSRPSGLKNSKLTAEEGKLVFSNTGTAAIETKVKYSNVDVAFDIVDVQRETSYNADGSVDIVRSCSFGLAFGIEVAGGRMQTKSALVVEFAPLREDTTNTAVVIKSGLNVLSTTVLAEEYDIFGRDDVYSVKISVKDSVVRVFIKNSTQSGYVLAVEQALSATPLGFFQIAALGAFDSNLQKGLAAEQVKCGSFSIDNLAIKNNDVGKILKVMDYMSSNACVIGDFEYEYEWNDSDLISTENN